MKQPRVGLADSHDQATRHSILTAAHDHFLAKGYKGVSMKEIADAVQVMALPVCSRHPANSKLAVQTKAASNLPRGIYYWRLTAIEREVGSLRRVSTTDGDRARNTVSGARGKAGDCADVLA
jgi:hypothetical protein